MDACGSQVQAEVPQIGLEFELLGINSMQNARTVYKITMVHLDRESSLRTGLANWCVDAN